MSGSKGTSGSKGMSGQAQDMAGDVKETASHLTDSAKDTASSKVSGQKDRAVDGINQLTSAITQVGDQMRDQNPTIASFADSAAERLNQFSQTLDTRDVDELLDEVQQFARRQPALFLGGAFALGLLGARFLKSSSPSSSYNDTYGYAGTGGYGRYSRYGASSGYGSQGGYGYRGYGNPRGFYGGSQETQQYRAYGNQGYGNQGYDTPDRYGSTFGDQSRYGTAAGTTGVTAESGSQQTFSPTAREAPARPIRKVIWAVG